jgi:hypothetical protein
MKAKPQRPANFLELPSFTRACDALMSDAELCALQVHLLENPHAGDVIPRSGGCRKLRWQRPGMGKRGGLRVIYFLQLADGTIVLVSVYAKSVQENIDPQLLKDLREAYESQFE